MIFNFCNIGLTDDEWIYLISRILHGWTEIPLSPFAGYDKENIRFYDGVIGTLLKQTERMLEEYPDALNQRFVRSWKYQGKLYRVIHESPVEDARYRDGFRMQLPKVDYHGMITHWTDDYKFEGLMYKLSSQSESIILEADTGKHIAFDVNGFRREYGFDNNYLAGEREIVFPMCKECIKEYRMSIDDFVNLKENRNEQTVTD